MIKIINQIKMIILIKLNTLKRKPNNKMGN